MATMNQHSELVQSRNFQQPIMNKPNTMKATITLLSNYETAVDEAGWLEHVQEHEPAPPSQEYHEPHPPVQ